MNYNSIKNNLLRYSLLKYLFVGIINTLFGVAIIFIMKWYFNFGDVTSNLLGYGCGISLSFFLNKNWTFNYRGNSRNTLFLFLLVIIVAYITNLFVVLMSIHILHINGYISHLFGIIPYTFIGYMGSKHFVFNNVNQ
ncbi:MAG TPA: GtrA family protein [Candidatus Thioglobus sp.]|nr:GtrA family protein [Candidatus Thioglobus sp.]